MKESTSKAYVETIELLKYFSIEQVKKIPEEKLKVFLTNFCLINFMFSHLFATSIMILLFVSVVNTFSKKI